MTLQLRSQEGRYLRVGHRGAAALAPENTLAGLEAALAHGVDWVELDVVQAGSRLLLGHSLAELRPGNPSLDEALAFLVERGTPELGIDLDIKGPGFELEIVDALRRRGVVERTIASSCFGSALRTIGRLEPRLVTGLSYPYDRYRVTERRVPDRAVRSGLAAMRRLLPMRIGRMLRRTQADAAMLHHLVVSRTLVERCHALGAAVFAWTVNDAAALERAVSLGVDGIISDEPRIFAEYG